MSLFFSDQANQGARKRTIFITYIYGDMYQKKQIFFSVLVELVELLLFLNCLFYIYMLIFCFLKLLYLFHLAIQSHITKSAEIDISIFQRSVLLHSC